MKIFTVATPAVDVLKTNVFLPSVAEHEPHCEVEVASWSCDGNGDFGSAGMRMAVQHKLEMICLWIEENAGAVILVSDVDIRYLRPFAAAMQEALGDGDIAFQRETHREGVNVGQMVIRCGKEILQFFREVLQEYETTGEWEQVIINRRLPELNHRLLPVTFANTKTGFCEGMHSFHAICTRPRDGMTSVEQKLRIFQRLDEHQQKNGKTMSTTSTGDGERPYTVAIVAMGPSHRDYLAECLNASSRHAVADETWAINAMGGVIQHDRLICMDALPYFAKAGREENPALRGYGDWLAKHPGPVYTQRVYGGYPGSVEYPLEEVLNCCGYAYFNNTVAYAVGLALTLQVRHLKLYGCDFTAGQHADGQTGRACVEYWLAVGIQRGMRVTLAPSTTLCDQKSGRVLYGYSQPPKIEIEDGKYKVKLTRGGLSHGN